MLRGHYPIWLRIKWSRWAFPTTGWGGRRLIDVTTVICMLLLLLWFSECVWNILFFQYSIYSSDSEILVLIDIEHWYSVIHSFQRFYSMKAIKCWMILSSAARWNKHKSLKAFISCLKTSKYVQSQCVWLPFAPLFHGLRRNLACSWEAEELKCRNLGNIGEPFGHHLMPLWFSSASSLSLKMEHFPEIPGYFVGYLKFCSKKSPWKSPPNSCRVTSMPFTEAPMGAGTFPLLPGICVLRLAGNPFAALQIAWW